MSERRVARAEFDLLRPLVAVEDRSCDQPDDRGEDVRMSRSRGVRRQIGMSRIVITGSTGVIGRRAIRELHATGHHVRGVTRSAPGRGRLASLGVDAVDADVFDVLTLEGSVNARDHIGGTAPNQVRAAVARGRKLLAQR